MKTKVKVIKITDCSISLCVGDEGYIDGYIRDVDGFPRAVVVIKNYLYEIPLYNLEVIDQ